MSGKQYTMQVADPIQENLRMFAKKSVTFAIKWFAIGINDELRRSMFFALSQDLYEIRKKNPDAISFRSVMICLADEIVNNDLTYREFLCKFFQDWVVTYPGPMVDNFNFKDFINTQRMGGRLFPVMTPPLLFVNVGWALRH